MPRTQPNDSFPPKKRAQTAGAELAVWADIVEKLFGQRRRPGWRDFLRIEG
jgi:hypothetical protein